MSVRPFDWRDLPLLIKYRNHGQFFDTALMLTRGPIMVSAGAMLSYFAPATGIFTYLCRDNKSHAQPLIGQVVRATGLPFSRLSFLAPEAALESDAFPALVEHILVEIGERGALHLLAEIDEHAASFESFRKVGFGVFARQRIWQLSEGFSENTSQTSWLDATEKDLIAVRSLYNNLVPGMVQQIEPLPKDHLEGLVYRKGDQLLAYVEIKYGSRGIWVQPFIHPDTDAVATCLDDLLHSLANHRSQPVYICVRSYQFWLESAIESLGAKAGPIQAVMVKHLAISKKVAPSFALQKLEGRQPEVTASIANRSVRNNL